MINWVFFMCLRYIYIMKRIIITEEENSINGKVNMKVQVQNKEYLVFTKNREEFMVYFTCQNYPSLSTDIVSKMGLGKKQFFADKLVQDKIFNKHCSWVAGRGYHKSELKTPDYKQ